MRWESKVVKVGTWLYDGDVEMSVRIIRQNYDIYSGEEYDEPPYLNSEGYCYYVVYGAPIPPEPGRPDQLVRYLSYSRTCLSIEEAMNLAPQSLPSAITWGRLPKGEVPE